LWARLGAYAKSGAPRGAPLGLTKKY
jgi:hypothetical protein